MPDDSTDWTGELYAALRQYAQKARKDVRLQAPEANSVTVHSPLCGSQLTLDAVIEDGRVKQLGHRVRACSLGQAATMIVAAHADGLDQPTARQVGEQLKAILAGTESHSDWPELELFALVRDIPNRHGAVLLPFRALEQLFDRAAAQDSGSTGRPAGNIATSRE